MEYVAITSSDPTIDLISEQQMCPIVHCCCEFVQFNSVAFDQSVQLLLYKHIYIYIYANMISDRTPNDDDSILNDIPHIINRNALELERADEHRAQTHNIKIKLKFV